MNWTPELTDLLRQLHAENLSYSQIAEQFQARGYACTKNSMVGKGRRLGLALRREPRPLSEKIQRRQQQRLRDAQRKRERRNIHMNGHGTGEPKIYRITPEKAGRKALRTGLLIDLDPDQCKWPLEEISRATYSFCCEDVWPGRSDRPGHCSIAYGPHWAR